VKRGHQVSGKSNIAELYQGLEKTNSDFEEGLMSRKSGLLVGILHFVLPTVMFGGLTLLCMTFAT